MEEKTYTGYSLSERIRWIVAFGLIAVLLVGMMVSLVLVLSIKQEERRPQNDFAAETVNSEHLRLTMSTYAAVAADNSVSKTIIATVLPVTAANKQVDWSVEWGDEEAVGDVSQCVTVTPASDGSTTATVTCKQAFTGTILVIATTRESGYQASCILTFIGIPTDIIVSGSVSPTGGAYKLGIGQDYVFDVGLTNPFDSVGAEFSDFDCRVYGIGSVVLGYLERISGVEKWYDTSNKTVTLDSLKDNFISASYADGQLTVTTKKSIESYYSRMQKGDGGRTTFYWDKFRSYADDCYFTVRIEEKTSGLRKDLEIRFDDTIVTGVNVNQTEMQF